MSSFEPGKNFVGEKIIFNDRVVTITSQVQGYNLVNSDPNYPMMVYSYSFLVKWRDDDNQIQEQWVDSQYVRRIKFI